MKNEIELLLIQALAFLEASFEDDDRGAVSSKLTWHAHEHVQRAWNLYSGSEEPHELSEECMAFVKAFSEE